ncbi:MAG: 30S ribosomal protein S6e [Candidatus Freyarchaeota archaeon]|nr:30S ribosomal protein S6e [Candidatus Freyrarchaeum guaymaensis]
MKKAREEYVHKLVISDPETGRSVTVGVDAAKFRSLIDVKIGEIVKGDPLGLVGYELQVMGGSDKDGFPMRPDIEGPVRKRVLLSKGPGFRPKRRGERRRKLVRGNTISEEIYQVNMKVVKKGAKDIFEGAPAEA